MTKEHDICYCDHFKTKDRLISDKIFHEKLGIVISADADLGERELALAITKIIWLKRKLRMGLLHIEPGLKF